MFTLAFFSIFGPESGILDDMKRIWQRQSSGHADLAKLSG
jgi:hypothetical protein